MQNDDPLNDPNFPDRPTHLDFWRLSESVLKQDGQAKEDALPFEDLMGQYVDVESIMYLADTRARFLLDHTGLPQSDRLMGLLISMYLDAFTTGVNFQKAGGTR